MSEMRDESLSQRPGLSNNVCDRRVCKGNIVDSRGRLVLMAGWNGYTTILSDAYAHLYKGQPDLVKPRFNQAKSSGLNVVRIWGCATPTLRAASRLFPRRCQVSTSRYYGCHCIAVTVMADPSSCRRVQDSTMSRCCTITPWDKAQITMEPYRGVATLFRRCFVRSTT